MTDAKIVYEEGKKGGGNRGERDRGSRKVRV